MAKILILGAGSMGTAFSFPCSENNHQVSIIGTHLENDFIDQINFKKKHPTLNCKIPNAVKFLKFIDLKDEIIKKPDLIVVAIISKGIEWAANALSKVLRNNVPILVLTKGLAVNNNNYEVLAHKMERLLKDSGLKNISVSGAGGPCLAKGLANKVHTSVVFANTDIKIAKQIARMVSTKYYHVHTSEDIVGVEICSAIKNIFSMAIGAAEGLCNPTAPKNIKQNNFLNTAASLLQQSIYEMIFFTEKLKGKKETVIGLAGIGDLYVSADGGRNSKMGYYLGKGLTFNDIKKNKMLNETVEGADLSLEIGNNILKDFDMSRLPIMESIINTILKEKPLSIEWKNFK